MTNEETIEVLDDMKIKIHIPKSAITQRKRNEALDKAIKALEQTSWIPVSERLPKENEYIGNVCKYYLIQDEYGDMHVAHLTNVGWIPMESLRAISSEIMAWRELPEPYKTESENT